VKNVCFSGAFLGVKKWGAKIEEKWGAFLDFSQYIAKKIIRLGFFAFPRRITHSSDGIGTGVLDQNQVGFMGHGVSSFW
jgi:hypothetical protein